MDLLILLVVFLLLLGLELMYFKLAEHFNIIDKPNSRSSHSSITIRGGGIVFVFAVFVFFQLNQWQYPYFIAGLFLIALISFLDDILTLNNKIRLAVHLLAVILMIYEWGIFSIPLPILLILAIIVIGVINAYNFMDGINGITGIYSVITLITLFYINQSVEFINGDLLIILTLSIVVFGAFNFRKKAKCFAGDVGSVSMAFILVFLIGALIINVNNWAYVLFLLIYGLDAVTTIIFRLIRGEQIFEAHRSHFYQYLANERKIPHLLISAGYAVCQLIINILIIEYSSSPIIYFAIALLLTTFCFVVIRIFIEGKERLLTKTGEKVVY